MRTNRRTPGITTHEGGPAHHLSARQQLERSVLSAMLFEKEFYEDGVDIAERVKTLVAQVTPQTAFALAKRARTEFKLRHMPLWILRCCAALPTHREGLADALAETIQRADELTEFLALYWKDGRQPVAAQVKKGLAKALVKFSEYDLAKYDRDNAVKLRDVLRLVHPAPLTPAQNVLFGKVIERTLETPDTWEVALSAGADKKATWERLLSEKKLGGLALLRNLRNMTEAGVDRNLIAIALMKMTVDRILPFRFISAARYAPHMEPLLEKAMFRCIEGLPELPGQTVFIIDVSGSMDDRISGRSEMTRMDAAAGLAVLGRELCEEAVILTFSNQLVAVPPRRGFALRDAINVSQPHGGTQLGAAVKGAVEAFPNATRYIVFTDEQSADRVPVILGGRSYMVNVASAKNGVGYGHWVHLNGFSESVLAYIAAYEESDR